MRLDAYMAEKGMTRSRSLAASMIKNGQVLVNGRPAAKPAEDVNDGDLITVSEGMADRYVSRGGLKLERALEEFGISVRGLYVCDIGASTGGFTDCLLRHGAAKVFAVDCGRDQLDAALKRDERVVSLEGFNAKELTEEITGAVDAVTMDVSFISQTRLYPAVKRILKKGGLFVSLIKPQFEAGRENVGRNGIVKDRVKRERARDGVIEAARGAGFGVIGCVESPVKGGDGNVEYIAAFIFE
ncbi:MAG: TlyA family RNA methyltransferase [Clostridia bacterium]|nr:TlyA family RNA methyltransferase [Clostridia bacterium]